MPSSSADVGDNESVSTQQSSCAPARRRKRFILQSCEEIYQEVLANIVLKKDPFCSRGETGKLWMETARGFNYFVEEKNRGVYFEVKGPSLKEYFEKSMFPSFLKRQGEEDSGDATSSVKNETLRKIKQRRDGWTRQKVNGVGGREVYENATKEELVRKLVEEKNMVVRKRGLKRRLITEEQDCEEKEEEEEDTDVYMRGIKSVENAITQFLLMITKGQFDYLNDQRRENIERLRELSERESKLNEREMKLNEREIASLGTTSSSWPEE
eukprot:Nk52_evm33s317 gene=Nk52_evmTU33s317